MHFSWSFDFGLSWRSWNAL